MNEKNKNRKLEDFVSKSLQSINDEPSDDVWAGLKTRLDANDRNKRSFLGWWPFGAMLLLTGLFAFWGFTVYNMNKKVNSLHKELAEQKNINSQLEKNILTCQEENISDQYLTEKLSEENNVLKNKLATQKIIKIPVFQKQKNDYDQYGFVETNIGLSKNKNKPALIAGNNILNKNKNEPDSDSLLVKEDTFQQKIEPIKKEISPAIEKLGFTLEEEPLKSDSLKNSIRPVMIKKNWEIGIVSNHGWTRFPTDKDYYPHVGLAANFPFKKNWYFTLGAAFGWSDYEIVFSPFITEIQRQETLSELPDVIQPPDPQEFKVEEIDVHWESIDLILGVQKRWVKPSGLGYLFGSADAAQLSIVPGILFQIPTSHQ